MTLGAHGIGQVLIYPYYTVNGGNGTLISIANTNEEGKALKVRFHEGLNGRVVADFNLYLSEWDVWVGQVFDTSADGAGPPRSRRTTAAARFPHLRRSAGKAPGRCYSAMPHIRRRTPTAGPDTQARTHEGYFEVIEMGVVTNATKNSLTAITHVAGVPAHCSQVIAAWGAQGYWTQAPATDLGPPTGGLYGSEAVLNIAEGTMYTANAEAIDGFSTAQQHSAPGSASPDLNTASASAGIVSAFVAVGGIMIHADYAKAEDAVSALFMASALYNEYVVDPAVAAASDWVVTLPTKRFYTDPLLLGANQPRAPFNALFGSAEGGTSCSPIDPKVFSREEDRPIGCAGFPSCPPVDPGFALCYSANVLTIGSSESVFATHLVHEGADFTSVIAVPGTYGDYRSGQLRIDLTRDADGSEAAHPPLTSANGPVLYGLPAFGFLAMRYINANVTPGVLANYSGDYPHRSRVICTNSTNPQNACQ
jgi:hypothetical protein